MEQGLFLVLHMLLLHQHLMSLMRLTSQSKTINVWTGISLCFICSNASLVSDADLGFNFSWLIVGDYWEWYFTTPFLLLPCSVAVFQVICHLLNSLDQGLVCSSNCNVETMRETSFLCYYLLLPSDKGMMLLRVIGLILIGICFLSTSSYIFLFCTISSSLSNLL